MFTRLIIFSLLLLMVTRGFAQSQAPEILGITPADEAHNQAWIDHLYEIGVKIEDDSIFVSAESQLAATDSVFQKIVYPESYTWQSMTYLFENGHYKIGFWYLINLYAADPANKEHVLKFVVPFDKLFEMDKVLTATFYTYALVDPSSTKLVHGCPNIEHPERIEAKLAVVKEMVGVVKRHRSS